MQFGEWWGWRESNMSMDYGLRDDLLGLGRDSLDLSIEVKVWLLWNFMAISMMGAWPWRCGTFEFSEIHACQLADMCEECRLPRRQVATPLDGLCNLFLKAV